MKQLIFDRKKLGHEPSIQFVLALMECAKALSIQKYNPRIQQELKPSITPIIDLLETYPQFLYPFNKNTSCFNLL